MLRVVALMKFQCTKQALIKLLYVCAYTVIYALVEEYYTD